MVEEVLDAVYGQEGTGMNSASIAENIIKEFMLRRPEMPPAQLLLHLRNLIPGKHPWPKGAGACFRCGGSQGTRDGLSKGGNWIGTETIADWHNQQVASNKTRGLEPPKLPHQLERMQPPAKCPGCWHGYLPPFSQRCFQCGGTGHSPVTGRHCHGCDKKGWLPPQCLRCGKCRGKGQTKAPSPPLNERTGRPLPHVGAGLFEGSVTCTSCAGLGYTHSREMAASLLPKCWRLIKDLEQDTTFYGEHHEDTAEALLVFGRLLLVIGDDIEGALEPLQRAFDIMVQRGETRPRRRPFSNWLRRCLEALGKSEDAARLAFNELDEDGSGELERVEIRLLTHQLGQQLPEHELTVLYREMDADSSGAIDFDEFWPWWSANKRNGEQAARTEFQIIDVDGSGTLDRVELGELCGRMGKTLVLDELDALMAELDVDGSGMIEFIEFWPWWSRQSPAELGDGGSAAEIAEVTAVGKAIAALPLADERELREAAARTKAARLAELEAELKATRQAEAAAKQAAAQAERAKQHALEEAARVTAEEEEQRKRNNLQLVDLEAREAQDEEDGAGM